MSLPPPPATPVRPVTDTLHGEEIVDPYRWLEDGENEEVRQWVEAQNAHSEEVLTSLPGREAIAERLGRLMTIGSVGAPTERGGRLFFTRRDGEQNQAVLLCREENGEERLLVDPNTLSAEGIIALDWYYPSPDGRLLAYGTSANGDEWSTLRVLDVERGPHLPDEIARTRAAAVAWLPDGSAFYYTRYPDPGSVPAGQEYYGRAVYRHVLGEDPDQDDVIFRENLGPADFVWVDLSDDGRRLLVIVPHGWESVDLYLRDLEQSSDFVHLTAGLTAHFNAEFAGDMLYLHTNLAAPRYRLLRLPLAHPQQENWQEVIPEDPAAVLESVTPAAGRLVAVYLRDAASVLRVFDAGGAPGPEVELPGLGTVTAVRGRWSSSDAFFAFESFTVPPTVFRLDPESGAGKTWATIQAPITPADYLVRQEWYTSRDGTRVPLFLVHRRDLDRSHPHPLLLTGYGGFNLARTPLFDRSLYLWLEHGGIFALPNLRGGSEYGEEWHRAGNRERKQNVFDDFIAAAEYLIAQGYTDHERLAISGRSNGGLLVGAALTQRPDLFRAVVCGVPLLDMVRYHLFLIARLWVPEYGSSDDPEEFRYLHAYSPYHRVQPGTRYPAVLLITAEADSRVDPLHARKMAALLQASTAGDQPILLKVEDRAGHGIGKPVAKQIIDWTDTWSFLLWQVGALNPPAAANR